MEIEERLKRVRLARKIIKSNIFTESAITYLCDMLGFSDTAFLDKSSKSKLKDFLLDKKYWEQKENKK